MSSYYFTIIGTRDNPIYELELSSFKAGGSLSISGQNAYVPGKSQFPTSVKELLPFISNSSLDLIDDVQWSSNVFNLGRIDSFYGLLVNAFITQGNIKFILCHDSNTNSNHGSGGIGSGGSSTSKYDDNSIKQFFMEVNELYVKCLLNPFYAVNDPISSPDFDLRIKLIARKYL